MSIELSLKLLLILLVLVSHDVENGISYDFNFVRWPPHLNFLPTPLPLPKYLTLVIIVSILHKNRAILNDILRLAEHLQYSRVVEGRIIELKPQTTTTKKTKKKQQQTTTTTKTKGCIHPWFAHWQAVR